jgi:hypothetical protein
MALATPLSARDVHRERLEFRSSDALCFIAFSIFSIKAERKRETESLPKRKSPIPACEGTHGRRSEPACCISQRVFLPLSPLFRHPPPRTQPLQLAQPYPYPLTDYVASMDETW